MKSIIEYIHHCTNIAPYREDHAFCICIFPNTFAYIHIWSELYKLSKLRQESSTSALVGQQPYTNRSS